MKHRIGPRPSKKCRSLWAWPIRPDLRKAGHVDRGERAVLIEFEIDDEKVCISDFNLWHYALHRAYLGSSRSDQRKYDIEEDAVRLCGKGWLPLSDPYFGPRIKSSWERIFEVHRPIRGITGAQRNRVFQATFWELPASGIRREQWFVGR